MFSPSNIGIVPILHKWCFCYANAVANPPHPLCVWKNWLGAEDIIIFHSMWISNQVFPLSGNDNFILEYLLFPVQIAMISSCV